MFCLRSWLPLLFIPTSASPAFIFTFFVCTYFLNRPCHYCSILLLILFLTSCNWSDRCFVELNTNWFLPRGPATTLPAATTTSSPLLNGTVGSYGDDTFSSTLLEMFDTSARALAGAAVDEVALKRAEWTGLGIGWLRSLLGRREWRIDCMDLYIRL